MSEKCVLCAVFLTPLHLMSVLEFVVSIHKLLHLGR